VVICHGDFHPLNILADKNQPTGVIDWTSAVIAEPAMDVGSAIANISAIPRSLRWGLHAAAQALISAALRRYERAYRARCPLDDQAVLYYEVFRAVAQLVWVGQARAAGRAGGDAFHSTAGVGNAIALIRKLSGVSLRFERGRFFPTCRSSAIGTFEPCRLHRASNVRVRGKAGRRQGTPRLNVNYD
jgi:Ser/Thr protein kinase RdoA (MazF antagonist)